MPKSNTKKKETQNTTTTPPEDSATRNSEEIVEVEWEKVSHVFDFKQRLTNLEEHFSSMCLQYEKNKAHLMAQIMYGQSDLYTMAQSLQKDLKVNENLTYELKLPKQPGEKGYFVRKDTPS